MKVSKDQTNRTQTRYLMEIKIKPIALPAAISTAKRGIA